jgi:hypothetical protein
MSDETPKPSWEYIYSIERKAARLATAEALIRRFVFLGCVCADFPNRECQICCDGREFLSTPTHR